MRLITLTLLFKVLLLLFQKSVGDSYEESLRIKALPNGHVHALFEFTIHDTKLSNHTRLFPRALSEILTAHSVEELDFTLTQGYWMIESWGEAPFPAPTGAHISSSFGAKNSHEANLNWKGLTSRLSGLTCASLNFLDEKNSIEPKYAYRPLGKVEVAPGKKLFIRVGGLPKEHVCTENLTPWSKLLPCGISHGLASLLRSKQVFNTHYHSEGIHFLKKEVNKIELKLTLSMIFDRSSLKPTEGLARGLLGSLAIFPCHPAVNTNIEFWNAENKSWKKYNANEMNRLKMAVVPEPSNDLSQELIFTPMKFLGGFGQEYGEVVVEMTNHLKTRSLSVLYVEVLPWFIRPYFHTMKIGLKNSESFNVTRGQLFHYTPGRDRTLLHKLEMDFIIPSQSTIILSFMVEKGHLNWIEYPPDANHGFYLEAAHFEVKDENSIRNYFSRILLVNLSTPDFSMPYNVICLTCTVVALAFGPIHNITTRRLVLKAVLPKKGLKEYATLIWNKIRRKKTAAADEKPETEQESLNEQNDPLNDEDNFTEDEANPKSS